MATGRPDDELENLVDEFLYLVEVGSGSQVADESERHNYCYREAAYRVAIERVVQAVIRRGVQ